ncbi:MAG TPA: glycosyltransferase family 1 protein [Patescibacteria group bacterium]|nr:glycosyltransferase family 1 protein [Patescibacteria group bacterium]
MKIGLDLRMVSGGSGISRYISQLTQNILTLDKTNKYVLLFNQIDQETKKTYEPYGHEMIGTGIAHYSFAEQSRLPGILNRLNLDLVHFRHFNVPLFYKKPFVVTIHDLTHTQIPGRKKSHFFHRLAYNAVINNAVKSSKKIIAVSKATKAEVFKYFEIPEDKIEVIYEAADAKYKVMNKETAFAQVSNRYGLKKPFILYVGDWRRYKNLPLLAEAFDRLIFKHFDYDLVLAGKPDPFYPEISKQVFSIKNANRVKAIGRVPEEDLPFLYNACSLFVLPSMAEGFGLTALEAAACGVPIACSDIPALREVLGQGAEYFDPLNLDNVTDVLEDLLSNLPRLEELANLALKRAAVFTWKKAAQETISLYEHAAK